LSPATLWAKRQGVWERRRKEEEEPEEGEANGGEE